MNPVLILLSAAFTGLCLSVRAPDPPVPASKAATRGSFSACILNRIRRAEHDGVPVSDALVRPAVRVRGYRRRYVGAAIVRRSWRIGR